MHNLGLSYPLDLVFASSIFKSHVRRVEGPWPTILIVQAQKILIESFWNRAQSGSAMGPLNEINIYIKMTSNNLS